MSATGNGATDGACGECLRRGWLLSRLSVRLDFRARDEARLLELLELRDDALIEAVGGRRRGELKEAWERFEPYAPEASASQARAGVESVCRHGGGYPRGLRGRDGAPRMLYVVGGARRLARLTAEPTVAIVGSSRPTDYGLEMARDLARGLAASGVTVISGLANGIAAAAHAGALEVEAPTVTVMAGGVDVVKPATRRECYAQILERGCAVAEAPCGFHERRWCEPARARTLAGLARMTIVVEAGERPSELTVARVAQALGRTVAAVPGRVTSPVSRGTNALLMQGAPLVRGAADALDLLYGVRSSGCCAPLPDASRTCMPRPNAPAQRRAVPPARGRLEPRLQTTLELVGAGRDTPGKLISEGEDAGETLLALSELELMGLLSRGDGGRYVPRESLAGL
jgi:DNA processing protein